MGELLNRGKLHALGVVRNRFPLGPSGRLDTPAQFSQIRFRNVYIKRPNRCLISCLLDPLLCSTRLGHGVLLLVVSLCAPHRVVLGSWVVRSSFSRSPLRSQYEGEQRVTTKSRRRQLLLPPDC